MDAQSCEWYDLWQHQQTIGSWNSFKSLTLVKQLEHGGATYGQSVFPQMQLLLKAAEKEFSRASATADGGKNIVLLKGDRAQVSHPAADY